VRDSNIRKNETSKKNEKTTSKKTPLRPLHRERINLLRAGVAGKHHRAVRSNADFRIPARAGRTGEALQTGERLYLAIGEPKIS